MAGVRTATVAVVATATLAAYVDSGGFGRYIVDGFAVNDNAKVFAGGLLVALLAIASSSLLALLQRAITSPGIRSGVEDQGAEPGDGSGADPASDLRSDSPTDQILTCSLRVSAPRSGVGIWRPTHSPAGRSE